MTGMEIILPALLPAVADGLRGIFSRLANGGANPKSVDDRIKLIQAEMGRLEALAKLDAPVGNLSPWVADLRGAFRYVAVGAILLVTMAGALVDPESAAVGVLLDLSGASMSFIIGERMYLGLRK